MSTSVTGQKTPSTPNRPTPSTNRTKTTFFQIYDTSVAKLVSFYDDRVESLRSTVEEIESGIRRLRRRGRSDDDGTGNDGDDNAKQDEDEGLLNSEDSTALSFFAIRVNALSGELDLALEFLQLNNTAFSKILKKYDKRSGSSLREKKLLELRRSYPFLVDGGELKKFRGLAAKWSETLEAARHPERFSSHSDEDNDSGSNHSSTGKKSSRVHRVPHAPDAVSNAAVDGIGISERSPRVHSIVANDKNVSNSALQQDKLAKDAETNAASGENSPKRRPKQKPRKSRSTYDSKASRILQKAMETVDAEVDLQKRDSPFFDQNAHPSPPSFLDSEIKTGEELGEGEFCKIKEVLQFDVKESCHICFLHGCFGGPGAFPPSSSAVLHSAAVGGEAGEDLRDINEITPTPSVKINFNQKAHQRRMSDISFDDNSDISDYNELDSDHTDEYDSETRGFLKDHCLRDGAARYAVKRIKGDLGEDDDIAIEAATDLTREAEFLAALSHPNVIKIRGTVSVPGHPRYGLVLDRLFDTLETRMESWKQATSRCRGKFAGFIGKDKDQLNLIWMERLLAVHDVAHAMEYLHSRSIMHRDLKPANIGFDVRGDIKLFDFGLAKELKPIHRVGDDKFQASGLTGTRRYMAPEVVQVKPYGLSADVFSFGLLMWEMLTSKSAFKNHTRQKHYEEVVMGGKRPKLVKSIPFAIRDLIVRCWAPVPSQRATFEMICSLMSSGSLGVAFDSISRSSDLIDRSMKSRNGTAGYE